MAVTGNGHSNILQGIQSRKYDFCRTIGYYTNVAARHQHLIKCPVWPSRKTQTCTAKCCHSHIVDTCGSATVFPAMDGAHNATFLDSACVQKPHFGGDDCSSTSRRSVTVGLWEGGGCTKWWGNNFFIHSSSRFWPWTLCHAVNNPPAVHSAVHVQTPTGSTKSCAPLQTALWATSLWNLSLVLFGHEGLLAALGGGL